ncbi:hypothetical protein B296_00040196 [Ensete ventricosum]|uniref:Uncharacterized protein n=1 Tax=Ensete ventricosum TaxID=4639 RepID=A0A426Z4P3_ENSVE|nr:hypothetical protein B296_00040196 [Ensete ventricosum]
MACGRWRRQTGEDRAWASPMDDFFFLRGEKERGDTIKATQFNLFLHMQGKQRLLYSLLDAMQALTSQAVVIGVSCRLVKIQCFLSILWSNSVNEMLKRMTSFLEYKAIHDAYKTSDSYEHSVCLRAILQKLFDHESFK